MRRVKTGSRSTLDCVCPRRHEWGTLDHSRTTPGQTGCHRRSKVTQVIVKGMVARAIVLVLTFFLPLRVITVSVT